MQRPDHQPTIGEAHPKSEAPTIDLANYRIVRTDGTIADLTRQEHRLLCALRDAGRVLSYEELAQRAWGYECGYTFDGISACVRRLRLKLGDDLRCPRYLHNVRGVGYRLDDAPTIFHEREYAC